MNITGLNRLFHQTNSEIINTTTSHFIHGFRAMKMNENGLSAYVNNPLGTLTEQIQNITKNVHEHFLTFLWWMKFALIVLLFVVILYFLIQIKTFLSCLCPCCSIHRSCRK